MSTATAYGSAGMRLPEQIRGFQVSRPVVDNVAVEFRPRPAPWLASIVEQLRGSIEPAGVNASSEEGMWLMPPVADAAIAFFQSASDIFPSEPYIYSSGKGDVVAEFDFPNAVKLTAILGESFAMAFAMIDGAPVKAQASTERGFDEARKHIGNLVMRISPPYHGSLGPK